MTATVITFCVFACTGSSLIHAADVKPTTAPAKKSKPLQWYTAYPQALSEAQKANKMILAYFCGTDWDEWTKKLDAEADVSEVL